MRGSRQFLDMAPPLTGQDTRTGTRLRWLTGVQSEGECAEQGLPGPAGGEMNPDRPSGLLDAGADFEQPGAQRLDLRRAPQFGQREPAKQIDQVVGEAVYEQTKGIGQEAVAAQPSGSPRFWSATICRAGS